MRSGYIKIFIVNTILLLPFGITAKYAEGGESSLSVMSDTLYLEEIIVTATKIPKLLKDSPVQTKIIIAKEIEKADATDIADLLQAVVPGIEFSYAMNQQVHMNFGGFGGQSLLFLIDGERLAGETMDDVDFSRIDMHDVERIEIVRGASSALYGSNAGGGVINIITKEASGKIRGDIDIRMGTHNARRYRLGLSNKWKKFDNSLSFSASRIDSYEVKNGDAPLTRVINTIYGHKTLNVRDKFSLFPGKHFKFSARLGFFMRELPREVDAPERYRSFSGGLNGEWNITSADKLEFSYAFDQYDKSQYRFLTGLDIRSYSNVQNSMRAIANHHFNDDSILTMGVDFMHDYLMNIKLTDNHHQQDNVDIFTQFDRIFNEKWEIVGTLRYDYFSDGRHSHLTPRLSARFTPVNCLDLRAAYGMGFRAPTLKEKYYEFDMAGIWIVKGNPTLKPEVSHNLNVSADYALRHFNLAAMAYYNHIENRISTGLPYYCNDSGNQLYLDYVNLGNFHSFGWELNVQGAWSCGLSARLSYACTLEHNKNRGATNASINQYLPARPHSLTARLDWEHRFSNLYSFFIGLNGRFLSSVENSEFKDLYNPDEGTVRVNYPAYTIWKLSVTQTFYGKIKLTLALDNIFNYRPKYYYLNAPLTDGINLQAGITLKI